MKRIRLMTFFHSTVEVPDGSTEDVSIREAKDALETALPLLLDNERIRDCVITGVNSVESDLREVICDS